MAIQFLQKASEKFLGERIGSGEILYNAVDSDITPDKNSSKIF